MGRTAALVPEFVVKTCPWAEHSDDCDDYVKQFSPGSIYSRGLKFLHFIYKSYDYDLTQGFIINDFLLYDLNFYYNKNACYKEDLIYSIY